MINTNKKLWFRAKEYGLGWYPISWQSWVITILYATSTILFALQIDSHSHSVSDTLIGFSGPFIWNTVCLLVICYVKGEKLGWRWGDK